MSNNRLLIDVSELRAALRQLTPDLAREGGVIVYDAADKAAQQVLDNYPDDSGNLRKGVKVKRGDGGTWGAGAVVSSNSAHAWMYENGTQARHNKGGASRGVMPAAPPGHAFIPVVATGRRAMYVKLKELVAQQGLEVSGDE